MNAKVLQYTYNKSSSLESVANAHGSWFLMKGAPPLWG
jgi:hypothetical protein